MMAKACHSPTVREAHPDTGIPPGRRSSESRVIAQEEMLHTQTGRATSSRCLPSPSPVTGQPQELSSLVATSDHLHRSIFPLICRRLFSSRKPDFSLRGWFTGGRLFVIRNKSNNTGHRRSRDMYCTPLRSTSIGPLSTPSSRVTVSWTHLLLRFLYTRAVTKLQFDWAPRRLWRGTALHVKLSSVLPPAWTPTKSSS
jgi:hypothetical protein